jgi:hypothetical protein
MEEMWSSTFAPEYWFGVDRGMVWRICDDVCGPLCLSMLPDVFEAAGGTMRSCRTHISGMISLFFRRAFATCFSNPR